MCWLDFGARWYFFCFDWDFITQSLPRKYRSPNHRRSPITIEPHSTPPKQNGLSKERLLSLLWYLLLLFLWLIFDSFISYLIVHYVAISCFISLIYVNWDYFEH
jgi:hypothetical protein